MTQFRTITRISLIESVINKADTWTNSTSTRFEAFVETDAASAAERAEPF